MAQLRLLAEGGAVGHLQHLYDNPDLTFREIKDILQAAASGRLTGATEKLDGLNIVFTWDESLGDVRVARSGGDIKRGGMGAEELAAKFAGRGNLKKAFDSAFSILRGALGAVPTTARRQVFGPRANRWYSAEVIYASNPNVINYDSNNLVFHGWPVFNVSGGSVEAGADDGGRVEKLSQYVDRMQAAVANRGWQVRGPVVARMQALADGSIVQSVLQAIDSAVMGLGLSDEASVGQYVEECLQNEVGDLGLPRAVESMVMARCLGKPGAPTLIDIRKNSDKSFHESITAFVRASPALMKGCIRPIELAINDFAVELLSGLNSTLIDDSQREVARLRSEVRKAIAAIKASGDDAAMAVLKQQMEKLRSVSNVTSPVEGVVFVYRGNAYKFTGSFAAANQILGLFKYGRKGTKL